MVCSWVCECQRISNFWKEAAGYSSAVCTGQHHCHHQHSQRYSCSGCHQPGNQQRAACSNTPGGRYVSFMLCWMDVGRWLIAALVQSIRMCMQSQTRCTTLKGQTQACFPCCKFQLWLLRSVHPFSGLLSLLTAYFLLERIAWLYSKWA